MAASLKLLLCIAEIPYSLLKPGGDIWEAVLGPGEKGKAGSLLRKLHHRGYIRREMEGGKKVYRITEKGKRRIVEEFGPPPEEGSAWDGKWRVVVFDIPEKARGLREALRGGLRRLGFGPLQRSVWITPHQVEERVREFVRSTGLAPHMELFIVERFLFASKKKLFERVWDLDGIARSYASLEGALSKELSKAKKLVEEGRPEANETLLWFGCFGRRRYNAIRKFDPCLPDELLPKEWTGRLHRERIEGYLREAASLRDRLAPIK